MNVSSYLINGGKNTVPLAQNIDIPVIAGAIAKTDRNKQVLDKLQVERERGITVKAQTASLLYTHQGQTYLLNLIDTPVSSAPSVIYVVCQALQYYMFYVTYFICFIIHICEGVGKTIAICNSWFLLYFYLVFIPS